MVNLIGDLTTPQKVRAVVAILGVFLVTSVLSKLVVGTWLGPLIVLFCILSGVLFLGVCVAAGILVMCLGAWVADGENPFPKLFYKSK